MLNPSLVASQWCYMRKLKKNHWFGLLSLPTCCEQHADFVRTMARCQKQLPICLLIYIRTMVMRLKNRTWWGFGAAISNTHPTLPKNLWWQIDHFSSHASGIKVEYLDEKGPKRTSAHHATGCLLWLSCGWTSTELTSGFILVTHSVRKQQVTCTYM
jgi:hypothetical protein